MIMRYSGDESLVDALINEKKKAEGCFRPHPDFKDPKLAKVPCLS